MYDIVHTKHRSFSIRDFCPSFTVDDKSYSIAPGTFRNKISKFCKQNLISFEYRTSVAFYTMYGVKLIRKEKVACRIEDKNSIVSFIESLPLGKRALHNIRLQFKAKGIWRILSSDSQLSMTTRSKDIWLDPITFGDIMFRVMVHRSDVVSVMVACSMNPIASDVNGLLILTEYLTRLEYEIRDVIARSGMIDNRRPPTIPRHASWIVTMWHFGRDGTTEFNGDAFNISWEDGRGDLMRVYVKDMKKQGRRVRIERQEYPKKSFAEAMESKLNDSDTSE